MVARSRRNRDELSRLARRRLRPLAGAFPARLGFPVGRSALLLDLGDASLEGVHEVDDRRLWKGLRLRDLLAGQLRLEHRPELAPVLVLELGGVELADEAGDHLAGELELRLLDVGLGDGLLDLGARADVLREEERLERERVAVRPDQAEVLLAPDNDLPVPGIPGS